MLYLIYIFDLFDKNENILWVLYFGTELTLFYSNSMLFLKYRENDSCFLPSSYPYLIGRTLNHYKIKPTVSICIMVLYLVKFQSRSFKNVVELWQIYFNFINLFIHTNCAVTLINVSHLMSAASLLFTFSYKHISMALSIFVGPHFLIYLILILKMV